MPIFYKYYTNYEKELGASSSADIVSRIKKEFSDHEMKILHPSAEDQNQLSDIIQTIDNYNVYVVGDLHGNFLKLISALVQCNFIHFKQPPFRNGEMINYFIQEYFSRSKHPFKKKGFEFLASCYVEIDEDLSNDQYPDFICNSKLPFTHPDNHATRLQSKMIEFFNDLFDINFYQIKTKEVVLIGDTLCDRGCSDFMTLCVFHWMQTIGINYKIIFGNHDLHLFYNNLFFNSTWSPLQTTHQHFEFFRSFDYWRNSHILGWCTVFKQMFLNSWLNHTHIYLRYFEYHANNWILLTHTPALKRRFQEEIIKLRQTISNIFPNISHENESYDSDINDIVRIIFSQIANNNLFPTHPSSPPPVMQPGATFLGQKIPNISFNLHLMPILNSVNSLCNFQASDWSKDCAYLGNPDIRNDVRVRYSANRTYKNSFGNLEVSVYKGNCNIHGHLDDFESKDNGQFCIDSNFGKQGSEDGRVRYALIAAL